MSENEWEEIRRLQRARFPVGGDDISPSHRHAFIHIFDSTHPAARSTILEEFLAHADYDCCHNAPHTFLTSLPFPLVCYDLIFVYVESADLARTLLSQASAALDRIPSSAGIVFAVAGDTPTYSFPRGDRIAFITTSHAQSSSLSAFEPLAPCLVRCVASAAEDGQTVTADEIEKRSSGALRLVSTPAAQISRQTVWGQFGMNVAFRCIVSCAVGQNTYAPKDVVGGLLKRLLASSTVQNIPLHAGRLLMILHVPHNPATDGSVSAIERMNDRVVEAVASILRDAIAAAGTGGDAVSVLSPDIEVLPQGECVIVSVSLPMMEAQTQLLVDYAAERVAADAQLRRCVVEMRVAHSFEVLSTVRLFLLLQALAHKRSVDNELRLCVESVCSWQFLHSDNTYVRDLSQRQRSASSSSAPAHAHLASSRSPPPPLPAADTLRKPQRGQPLVTVVGPSHRSDSHGLETAERRGTHGATFTVSEMQLRALVDEAVGNKVALALRDADDLIERAAAQKLPRRGSHERTSLDGGSSAAAAVIAAANEGSQSNSYQDVLEEMGQLQQHTLEAFSHYGDRLGEVEDELAALAESSTEGVSAVEKQVDHVSLLLEALQRKMTAMERSIQEKDHRLVVQEDRLTVLEAATRASEWRPTDSSEKERGRSHRSSSVTPPRVASPTSNMLLKVRKELLDEQERCVGEIDELKKRVRDLVTTSNFEQCKARIGDLETWRAEVKKTAESETKSSDDSNKGVENDNGVTLHSLQAEISTLREEVSAIQVELDLSNVPEIRQRLSQLSDDVALSLEAMRKDFAQSFAEKQAAREAQVPLLAASASVSDHDVDVSHARAKPEGLHGPTLSLSFIAERIRALEVAAEEVTSRTADFHDTIQITIDSVHEQVLALEAGEAQLQQRMSRLDDAMMEGSDHEEMKRGELKRRMQRDLDTLVDGVNGIVEEVVLALQSRTEDQLEQTKSGTRACMLKCVETMVRWLVQDCGVSTTNESVGMLLLRIEQLLLDNLSSVPYTYMTPQRATFTGKVDGNSVPTATSAPAPAVAASERPNGLVSPSRDDDDDDDEGDDIRYTRSRR